jgi:hypothetical protein
MARRQSGLIVPQYLGNSDSAAPSLGWKPKRASALSFFDDFLAFYNFGEYIPGTGALSNLLTGDDAWGDITEVAALDPALDKLYRFGNGLENKGGGAGLLLNSNGDLLVPPTNHEIADDDFTVGLIYAYHKGVQGGGQNVLGAYQSSSVRLHAGHFASQTTLPIASGSNSSLVSMDTLIAGFAFNFLLISREWCYFNRQKKSFSKNNQDFSAATFGFGGAFDAVVVEMFAIGKTISDAEIEEFEADGHYHLFHGAG